jgi:hypothetical protein
MKYIYEFNDLLGPDWARATAQAVGTGFSFMLPADSAQVTFVAKSLASFLPIESEAILVSARQEKAPDPIGLAVLSRLIGVEAIAPTLLGAILFDSGEADIAEGILAVMLLFNITFSLFVQNGWFRLEYGRDGTISLWTFRRDIEDDFRHFVQEFGGRKIE